MGIILFASQSGEDKIGFIIKEARMNLMILKKSSGKGSVYQ